MSNTFIKYDIVMKNLTVSLLPDSLEHFSLTFNVWYHVFLDFIYVFALFVNYFTAYIQINIQDVPLNNLRVLEIKIKMMVAYLTLCVSIYTIQ